MKSSICNTLFISGALNLHLIKAFVISLMQMDFYRVNKNLHC